jgi:hypothetical protein
VNVHLATAADEVWSRSLREEVQAVALRDRVGRHSVVDDPAEADIILFLDAHQLLHDWRMHTLRTHAYVRHFPQKVFVYDERDEPRDLLPGAYVCMPRGRFNSRRHRAVGYYKLKTDTRSARDAKPDLLFSFQGRNTGGVRTDVLALRCARSLVQDTSQHDFFDDGLGDASGIRDDYRVVMGRSKFVLCPRGAGTSSFRLFEALACGRVPVILSDDWVAPSGIDWASCAVRIAEGDVEAVPRRLEAIEKSWPTMSAAAAAAYDEWFGPDVWFHRIVENCAELERVRARTVKRQALTIAYWRAGARSLRHAASGWR